MTQASVEKTIRQLRATCVQSVEHRLAELARKLVDYEPRTPGTVIIFDVSVVVTARESNEREALRHLNN